ncbi:MAG: Gfo/Idh/MocA family oxidoreductase [Planctomycetes bacterium]|nr:Gfo/Idh/MocA family oxidoreductase [Planctomycetota bacterium]
MNIHRREFLGTSAALAAGLAIPMVRADEKKPVSPGNKVVVALIGCGGMGRGDLRDFLRLPDFEVAAVCDVDGHRTIEALNDLKTAGRPTEKVQVEKDFRKVLDRKDIDAVIIATPDHWHPYIFLAACAQGKDIYCEKPISHNIVEGRAMVNAARKHQRVVQIGTQQRSGKHFQDAVQYLQAGHLGHISWCRTWITNKTGPEGAGNPPDCRPPCDVDYDLWLGPAPKRPFNPNRFHYQFRWFWDYGNGLCNDWGVHLNDIILWGMKASAPLSVSALGGRQEIHDNSDTPDTLDIYYEYPGFTHVYTVRRGRTLSGFHGKDHGMEFQGENGTLTLDRGGWIVLPEGMRLGAEKHGSSEQHFAHVQNFLHCLRNRGEKTASDIEDMHRATTTCHLANISYKVKRRIYWDAQAERCYRGYDPETKKFLNEDMEANAYLLREPRKPWSLTV